MRTVVILLLAAFSSLAQPRHLYTHPSCNYSFQYPDGWQVEPDDDAGFPCEVRVRPADHSRSIWIDAGRGDAEAAMSAAYFFREGNAVKVEGRKAQKVTAFPIALGALHGMRANGVLLECEKEPDGGKLCEHDLAYLVQGNRWVNLQGYSHEAALELALKSVAILPPKSVTYVHPTCGYSFEHLTDWVVRADPDEKCGVVLVPKDFEKRLLEEWDVDIDSVYVEAGTGGFEDGAREADFMHVTDLIAEGYGDRVKLGSWVAFGRGASVVEPHAIELHGLRGLRADQIEVGFFHVQGGYAGLGEYSSAFLTNGKRWVVVSGPGHAIDSIDLALSSVALQRQVSPLPKPSS